MTQLRDYQQRVCRLIAMHFDINGHKPALLVMPTGAGKTQVFSAIAKYVTRLDPTNGVLVLAHRQELVGQAEARLRQVMPDTTIGVWCGGLGRKEEAPVMVGTIQSVRELSRWPKLIIIDECFPAGTLVDGRPIESLSSGDVVLSYNHSRSAWERRRVVRTFKSKPHQMVTVRLSDGREIVCTSGHPFFTKRGYIAAALLNEHDEVANYEAMRVLRSDVSSKSQAVEVLQSKLLIEACAVTPGREGKDCGTMVRCFGGQASANESVEPNEVAGGSGESVSKACFHGTQAEVDGRERTGSYSASVHAGRTTKLANGSDRKDRRWLSAAPLQAGHSEPTVDGSHRNRRPEPFIVQGSDGRQEEGGISSWSRVDRVEVHQQTSDGRFGGLCPDGFVYNIEVDGNHNYVVNGVLVHNCHNINDEDEGRYRDLLRDAPEGTWILGVTATPFRLTGGPIYGQATSFFPSITARVSIQELIAGGFLVRPRLYGADDSVVVDTSNVDIRAGEYVTSQLRAAMPDDLVDRQVDDAIGRTQLRSAVVWFCLTIEQAERVAWRISEYHGETAAVVHSRISQAQREANLQCFKIGMVKHLVNVAVLTEGWDEPKTDAIILLRPTVSPVFYVQSVGRGMRPAAGKADCLVLDYGGVVERLGPVDDPFLEVKKRGKGEKDAPLKICQSCFEYVAMATRVCECGYEFPVQAKGNEAPASGMGMVSGGENKDLLVQVQSVVAEEHVSRSGNHCVRITYRTGPWSEFTEYLMWEHDFQARKANRRLCDLGIDEGVAVTIDGAHAAMEAIREAEGLWCPWGIRVQRDGKYWRVNKLILWPSEDDKAEVGRQNQPEAEKVPF